MTEYLTEQEQIEQIKGWAKQYGPTLLAGIILALILVSGWRYWERYQTAILAHASSVYDEMLNLRAQNDAQGTVVQANKLLTHYAKTPYASMAAMMLARNASMQKNYAEAKTQLTWVVDHSKSASMREIAKIRLARLAITEKKPEAALALLKKVEDKSFQGLASEIKGDAYLMLTDTAKAKEMYGLALQELPKEEISKQPILQMKLDNLNTKDDINL